MLDGILFVMTAGALLRLGLFVSSLGTHILEVSDNNLTVYILNCLSLERFFSPLYQS